ncbi:HORMA domain protein [Tribonema minus]|uniref:HORMA domain protein n=1 Tax=Tribonema minus TaxID=303371 RepID=A0A835YLW3_9STRA|nr:HORMA domain protein [Tribonema minus]
MDLMDQQAENGGFPDYRRGSVERDAAELRADVLLEFLEAAIHTTLHARGMFERRRAYEVPVWMSRHPELNEYIAQALANARPLLVERLLHRVYLCFKRENGAIEESFVFELQESDDAPAGPITLDAVTELEAHLRAVLVKINMSGAALPSREGCTFSLLIGCAGAGAATARAAAAAGDKWLVSDAQDGRPAGELRVVPVRSVRVPHFRLQAYALVAAPEEEL